MITVRVRAKTGVKGNVIDPIWAEAKTRVKVRVTVKVGINT